MGSYYKVAGSSEPSTYTWTIDGLNNYHSAALVRRRSHGGESSGCYFAGRVRVWTYARRTYSRRTALSRRAGTLVWRRIE